MGKLLQPKLGLLKIIVDAITTGIVKDAIIIPISIVYDKIIETPSYIDELLGVPKEKETLSQLFGNLNIVNKEWGRVHLSFADPFSLREYIDFHGIKKGKTIDTPGILKSLGFKVLSDINTISVTMPTALVGTILLTLRGRGVGKEEVSFVHLNLTLINY